MASITELLEAIRGFTKASSRLKTVTVKKTLLATAAYLAGDVISEASAGATPWTFDFGGGGYLVKGVIVSATTGLTDRLVAFLYNAYPTCEMDDQDASLQPNAADEPNFIGTIEFPALTDVGSGASYTTATPSTYGNLPIAFSEPKIYAVLVTRDTGDFLDYTKLSFKLTAEMVEK